MIPSFSLGSPGQIIFGPGRLVELGKHLPFFGARPLLVLGRTSFTAGTAFAILQQILSEAAIPVKTVHISAEPSPAIIDAIVADQQYGDIDLIVAVGGGSTLDAGKALAAMLVEGGEVGRFLEGIGTMTPSGKKLPFIAIPTTAGTGSEATSNAVLSAVGSAGFKRSLRHNNYFANLALVDPLLTLSCPKTLTLACGMDCYTQLVEGYLSTGGCPLTDNLALEGIKHVSRALPALAKDGDNLAARCAMSYGTLLSGLVLANAGLGTVHGFAGAIGGLFAIPHGVICGSLMARTNKASLYNLRSTAPHHPALDKYTTLGQMISDQPGKSDAWYQDHFIFALEELKNELAIPSLRDYGVIADDAPRIAGQTANKNNPAKLSTEELMEILRADSAW